MRIVTPIALISLAALSGCTSLQTMPDNFRTERRDQALEVGSMDELLATKARLEAAGIDVIGPTNHTIFQSIYFFDPNGHRIELAADIGTPEQYAELKRVAQPMLDEWSQTKKAPRHADWLHTAANE